MTQEATRAGSELIDGLYIGPLRHSRNTAINSKGSIHDDATASKLGFRGGTVAGSIHLDLFPPLLLRAFGQRWFEHGNLSMYFTNPTVDDEAVRAVVRAPESDSQNAQVDVWVDREDGMRVGEGTAAVGDPGVPSALSKRDISRFAEGEYRILASVQPGDLLGPENVRYSAEDHARRMQVITEPLDWYTGASPWGGAVLSPAAMVNALYSKIRTALRPKIGQSVGLFGAIELRNVHGPIFIDQDYTVKGEILSRGQSPKTEYFWFETYMDDAAGVRIAEMRMLLRFMKASSPLWETN
jgi:hypothetical protein